MKFLKREIISEKTVGRELIETVIEAVCFTIVVYICLSYFNETILTVLNIVKSGEISALKMTIILFPIIIIVSLGLKLGTIVIKLDQKK